MVSLQAVKRFTAVTRGGGYRYESEYIAGLKDRELAKAVVGAVSIFTESVKSYVADDGHQAFDRENPTLSVNIVVPLCRHTPGTSLCALTFPLFPTHHPTTIKDEQAIHLTRDSMPGCHYREYTLSRGNTLPSRRHAREVSNA